jgi:hypothetical protein
MSPSARADEPILTLEPLVIALRAGLEDVGWSLSGLQKTTSHEFEGRWKGESTRSAYLFFHREHRDEPVSIDVYLDETSRGLTGNIALAVDLLDLGDHQAVPALLSDLREICVAHLPEAYRTPISLRFRLRDVSTAIEDAEGEVRFKLVIPKSALDRGHSAVEALAGVSARAFEELLEESRLRRVMTGR